MTPLAGRRLARIARMGSLPAVARAVRREVWLRGERARLERALRTDEPLVVGPFVGELGFELLYWRPMVRKLLRSFEVDAERVTAVSRGGAGLWYREVAATTADVLDAVTADELRDGVEARVTRTGQRKQIDVDDFDGHVLSRLGLGDRALLHPLHVYWGFRFVWEGLESAAAAHRYGDYDELEREARAIEGLDLPDRFIAVKIYENECLPSSPANHESVRAAIAALADRTPLVVLHTGLAFDDHVEWEASGVDVISLAGLLDARRNVAQQAEIVARAEGLVATYGGFSYLGPFLGVPTVAVASEFEWNRRHEHVLRAVRPGSQYVRVAPELAAATAEELFTR